MTRFGGFLIPRTEMSMAVIGTEHLAEMICKAIDVDPGTVTRLIVDIQAGSYHPAYVYVARVGDHELLNVDWNGGLENAKIEFAEPTRPEDAWVKLLTPVITAAIRDAGLASPPMPT